MIYEWLHFDPFMGVQVTPKYQKCAKNEKNGTLYWNQFRWKSHGNLCQLVSQTRNFLKFPRRRVAEKTENILPILFLEIFKLDIRISGKILRGILMRHMFCCLVTPHDPLGVTKVTKHQNMSHTKIPLKILPEIWISSLKISKIKIGKIFSVFSATRELKKILSLGC